MDLFLSVLFVFILLFISIRAAAGGLRILYTAVTNLKLYRRWAKIQLIKENRLKIEQEEKLRKETELAIKQNNIKKFAIRRQPKTLAFCKFRKKLFKFIEKTFIFILKAIGIIILILLICRFLGFICSNPLYIITFLLILILLK